MFQSKLEKHWPLVLALTLQLALVWSFDFFPTVDGPAHAHLAYGMAEAASGNAFYADYFTLNDSFPPNLLTELSLFLMMRIFPPLVPEKILLTIYFVTFAVAATLALRSIEPASTPLSLFVFMCSISFPLGFGFYNFSFSTVLLLAWLAYWYSTRNSIRLHVAAGHLVFSFACYATHIFALGVSLLAISAICVGLIMRHLFPDKAGGARNYEWWRHFLRTHVLPPILGSIPALLLASHFLFQHLSYSNLKSAGAADLGIGARLLAFISGYSLAFFSQPERVVVTLFSVLIIMFVYHFARRGGRFRESLPFACAAMIFLLVYLIIPSRLIVRWMPFRFMPLVFVMMILWLATLLPRDYSMRKLTVAGLAFFFLVTVARFSEFTRLNNRFEEFISVSDNIPPHSTLVALRLSRGGRSPDPFFQAGSYLATITQSVDLKNFQGQARHHPIQFLTRSHP